MNDKNFLERLAAILNDARKEGVSEVLLNYTPADSLGYLVGPEADIAYSSVVYQDDPNEIKSGARRFIAWLVNAKVLSAAHGEALAEKIDSIVRRGKELWPYTPYVFCLTAQVDNPYFWCRYTDARNGGFAVGIDRKKLVDYFNQLNQRSVSSASRGRLIYLMPVLYMESDRQQISSYLELMYQQRRDAFDTYAKGAPSADCNDVLAQILVAAAVIKDEKYAVEREWRLVLHPTFADVEEANASLKKAIKEKQKNPKPRLKTGIFRLASRDLKDIIRCIWVSPQGDRTTLHAKVQKQLGALLSPMTGGEIVADGRPFVRNSSLSASRMCATCPIRATCPNAKNVPSGGDWNHPRRQPRAPQKRKGGGKSLLAIVALLAVCCAAYFIFSGGEKKTAEEKDKQTKRIKEVKPAAAPTNKVEKANEPEKGVRYTRGGRKIKVPKNPWGTPIPKDLEYKPHWEYTPEDYARIDPGYAERHERFLQRQAANPWKTGVDSQLSVLLFSEPGKPSALIPFTPRFKEQFLKSIKTPIVVSKDDPPELQEQKRKMIETKIWLKDQIDDGKDIVKILNDEIAYRNKVQGLRDNLMRELREVQKTATSIEEVQDYVNAANQMLEKEGGAKVGLPMKYTQMLIDRRAAKGNYQANENKE